METHACLLIGFISVVPAKGDTIGSYLGRQPGDWSRRVAGKDDSSIRWTGGSVFGPE
jgi:phage tail tape-measure protein